MSERLEKIEMAYSVDADGGQELVSKRPSEITQTEWLLFQTRAETVTLGNLTYTRTKFRADDDPPGIYITYERKKD